MQIATHRIRPQRARSWRRRTRPSSIRTRRIRSSRCWTSRRKVTKKGGTMRLGAQPCQLVVGTQGAAALRRVRRQRTPSASLRIQQRLPRAVRRSRVCLRRHLAGRKPGGVHRTAGSSILLRQPVPSGVPEQTQAPHPLFRGFIAAAHEHLHRKPLQGFENGRLRMENGEWVKRSPSGDRAARTDFRKEALPGTSRGRSKSTYRRRPPLPAVANELRRSARIPAELAAIRNAPGTGNGPEPGRRRGESRALPSLPPCCGDQWQGIDLRLPGKHLPRARFADGTLYVARTW